MNTQAASHMTIGAVARAAGVGIDTVRFYEREGLLPAPQRRLSGYRDYGPDAVRRLRFVRRAKALGFSLDEIRELLALSADRERAFAESGNAPKRASPKWSCACASCAACSEGSRD